MFGTPDLEVLVADFLQRVGVSQNGRLQEVLQRTLIEKEAYARVCVCLVRALRGEIEMVEVGGQLAVRKVEMDGVPGHFKVGLGSAVGRAEVGEGEEEVEGSPGEELVVVLVEKVDGGNGLVVPGGPRLEMP